MSVPGRYKLLDVEKRRYREDDKDTITAWQLHRFNTVWKNAKETIPFYASWAKTHELPDEIGSLMELRDFPLLFKSDIVENQDLVFQNLEGASAAITGGSSGQPARFPRGPGDDIDDWANLYAARAWWGIDPTSRLALVWGHSHLYGSGTGRVVNLLKRRAKDFLTRTKRLDAYLTSDEQSRQQLEEIIHYRPEYVVGYTSALERLARISTDSQRDALGKLNLKAVIATAETIEPNGVEVLRTVFKCPVVIEYGAAEFGAAAYSRTDTWNLQVMWGSRLLMKTGQDELAISTLTDKAFPLINYATGDIVKVKQVLESGSILTLESIQGRKADTVVMRRTDGSPLIVSAIQPVHILKGEPEIIGIQFELCADNAVNIFVKVTDSSALPRIKENFYRTLLRDYPYADSDSVNIVEANEIELTTAGKAKLFR